MAEPGHHQRIVEAHAEISPRTTEFSVSVEAFVQFVTPRLGLGSESVSPDKLALEDLYLACACASQDPAAVATFFQRYRSDLERTMSRLQLDAGARDDAVQAVAVHLFVGSSGGPKIVQYSGRGSLAAWVRVVAVRLGLNTRRRGGPSTPILRDDDLLAAEDGVGGLAEDPELGVMRAGFQDELRSSFGDALASLAQEDRVLLKRALLHELGTRELGRLYGVHFTTVARRIAKARRELIDGTRSRLVQRLGLSKPTLDSLLRDLDSQLHLTLERAFSADPQGA